MPQTTRRDRPALPLSRELTSYSAVHVGGRQRHDVSLTTPYEATLLHGVRLTPEFAGESLLRRRASASARRNDAGRDLNDISSPRLRGARVSGHYRRHYGHYRGTIASIPFLPTFSRVQSPSGPASRPRKSSYAERFISASRHKWRLDRSASVSPSGDGRILFIERRRELHFSFACRRTSDQRPSSLTSGGT